MRQPRSIGRLAPVALLGAAYVACCTWPYLRWWADPILFDDDLVRVGGLRRSGLSGSLFRPFNEHMAPLFEVVSWAAWRAAGREVLAVASTFRVASFVARAATAAMLGLVVGREARSTAAPLAALALFSLSSVSAETVLWYSASSFEWAAAASMLAWYAAARSESASIRAGRGWLVVAASASAAAPAFSAIGILAGPLASLRAVSGVEGVGGLRGRIARAPIPWFGTAAYLGVCACFRYKEVVGESVGRNLDLTSALWAAVRAPALVLLPGLVGSPSLAGRMPDPVAAALTISGLIASLAWAVRSRQRPLILGGLAWIAGGYLAAYATRARAGDVWVFAIGRYHLFPQIGLIWLVAAGLGPRLWPLNARPIARMAGAGGLAAALLWVQGPGMREAVRPFRDPEQPRALAAAARLEAIWGREGFTLAQAMGALDPIRARWFPRPVPFQPLLYLFPQGPAVATRPDAEVRPALVAGLSPEDREAIFGGMEATRHRLAGPSAPAPGATVARPRSSSGMTPIGVDRYEAAGGDSCLDFDLGPGASRPRYLTIGVDRPVEVWWAGDSEGWSRGRSVAWAGGPGEAVVPLEALPHWRAGCVTRLRVVARRQGPISVSPPRLFP